MNTLREDEAAAKDEFRIQAESTELGEYNLILAGLSDFEDVLKVKNSTDGKETKECAGVCSLEEY